MNQETGLDSSRRKSSPNSDGLGGKYKDSFHCRIRVYPCLSAVALALILAGCGTTKSDSINSPPNQMAKHLRLKKQEKIEINYLLFLPKGYEAKAQKRWPLILFLHGAGERGTNVWKVATHGPPKNVTSKPDFPFILVSPQCPEGRIWSNDQLLALLNEVIGTYAVDKSRIYLTGLSMGGYGTWSLGLAYPELFAAIAPICGGGEFISPLLSSRDKREALRSLGIWAFHGAKDPVVPLAESERMVELSKKLGVKEVKLTVYPEAGHDAWTETYKNPDLYEWLLEHRRTAKK
jgi:predicted peptidase